MIKINEKLSEEILYTFLEDVDLDYKIKELYEKIKKKDYNNYKSFLDILCELIIYIEKLSMYTEFYANIFYDNLNFILENMKEDWDLSNETINNRVEFLFNKIKEK